jgi:hypothetical protein
VFASVVIRYGWEPGNLPQVVRPVKQETQTLLIDRPSGEPGKVQIVKHATDDEGGLPEDTGYAIASWHTPSGHRPDAGLGQARQEGEREHAHHPRPEEPRVLRAGMAHERRRGDQVR